MRVFLDANILFSAAKSDGAVRALLRLLLDRGHECRVDAYVVAEARRNLVDKGPQAIEALDALLGHLQVAPAQADAGEAAESAHLPPKTVGASPAVRGQTLRVPSRHCPRVPSRERRQGAPAQGASGGSRPGSGSHTPIR